MPKCVSIARGNQFCAPFQKPHNLSLPVANRLQDQLRRPSSAYTASEDHCPSTPRGFADLCASHQCRRSSQSFPFWVARLDISTPPASGNAT
jgi:hypothetical protein